VCYRNVINKCYNNNNNNNILGQKERVVLNYFGEKKKVIFEQTGLLT